MYDTKKNHEQDFVIHYEPVLLVRSKAKDILREGSHIDFFHEKRHLYKVCKIQHFHKCIYIFSINVFSLSAPGFAPSVL